MPKRRIFLAIELPEDIISKLERLQDDLRRVFPAARMVNPAGMHLTVKFIGYADDAGIAAVADAARSAAAETTSFKLSVSGLGGFPSLTRPRVIWAGASDRGESAKLSAGLDKLLRDLVPESEKRPFKPHITLARINKPAAVSPEAVEPVLAKSANIGSAPADKMILFESHLLSKGAEYEAIDEFMFGLDTNTCL
jgi:2'-5' RNA ligase